MPRRLLRTTAFALALTGLGAASGCESTRQVAERSARPELPLWRQPPDKRPGPALAPVAGRARSFELRTLARGLSAPVQVVSRPGDPGRLYVAEQAGLVRVLGRSGERARTYLDLRPQVRTGLERGLLSIVFSPRGERLYALYTNRRGDTRVREYRAGARAASPTDARTLLALDQPFENHNGGTLLFDERGRLVLGLGDGGSAFDPDQRAQHARSRLGKILRSELRGARPKWEIVASGLRNPWRMSFDRLTGRLWLGDVGQDRVEEVDALWLPETGQRVPNLGWAAYEGPLPLGRKRLDRGGPLVWPVAGYRHEAGHCSVTGGYVYRGRAIRRLRGRYLFGDFCRGTMWSLRADAGGAARDLRREEARLPGLVSFGEGPRGELYAVSAQGTVERLFDVARN